MYFKSTSKYAQEYVSMEMSLGVGGVFKICQHSNIITRDYVW